jgi:hypothetical protein
MKITTLIFNYVCAVCWSPLIERDSKVICARYASDHAGYHRLSGVTWQREHSDLDRNEVIRLYQDLPPYSYMLGLATPPTRVSAEKFNRNKRALGRDDSGLF